MTDKDAPSPRFGRLARLAVVPPLALGVAAILFAPQLRSGPQAARMASRERIRPIVLTSLTTIAGLLPLLVETSTQAQLLIPLVASLAFGLLTATVSSLFLVPATFVVLADAGLLRRR